MEKSKLQEVLERTDLELRSYSGRGMYGKECIGVDVSDLGEFFSAVLGAVEGEDNTGDIQYAFQQMKTDSMGRDIIVYFPFEPFVRDEEEQDEDDNDSKFGMASLEPGAKISA